MYVVYGTRNKKQIKKNCREIYKTEEVEQMHIMGRRNESDRE